MSSTKKKPQSKASDAPKATPKRCFIITPIGPRASLIRENTDGLIEAVIRPAAEAPGYTAVAAHELDNPESINLIRRPG